MGKSDTGIDFLDDFINMLNDFTTNIDRIFCLINSVPNRIANIKEGVNETTYGSIEYIDALGKSAVLSKNESFAFVEFIGIFIFSYLACAKQFLFNLYKCIFPWYFLGNLGKIFYLPVNIVIWMSSLLFNIDLSTTEKSFWDLLEDYNNWVNNTFGIHIIHFPDWVRQDCYICQTLKSSVISNQSDVIKTTFRETIPNILASAGRDKLNRGSKLYNESILKYAREPNKVK